MYFSLISFYSRLASNIELCKFVAFYKFRNDRKIINRAKTPNFNTHSKYIYGVRFLAVWNVVLRTRRLWKTLFTVPIGPMFSIKPPKCLLFRKHWKPAVRSCLTSCGPTTVQASSSFLSLPSSLPLLTPQPTSPLSAPLLLHKYRRQPPTRAVMQELLYEYKRTFVEVILSQY